MGHLGQHGQFGPQGPVPCCTTDSKSKSNVDSVNVKTPGLQKTIDISEIIHFKTSIDIFAPIHWFYSCWKTRLRFADKAESFIAQRLVFQYQLTIRISTNIQPTKCMIVISKTSSKMSAYCCMQIVFYYIHKAHLRLFKSSELRY